MKRYKEYLFGVVESDNGKYVLYDEYSKLQTKLDQINGQYKLQSLVNNRNKKYSNKKIKRLTATIGLMGLVNIIFILMYLFK